MSESELLRQYADAIQEDCEGVPVCPELDSAIRSAAKTMGRFDLPYAAIWIGDDGVEMVLTDKIEKRVSTFINIDGSNSRELLLGLK